MSKKGETKQESRARKEARRAEEAYVKPFLARVFDAVKPGEYSEEEDLTHVRLIWGILAVAALIVVVCCFIIVQANQKSVEATLLIPSTSYARGQEQTVKESLEGNGFKDIQFEEDGDVIAHGTSDMVSQYKESYRKRNVEKLSKLLDEDYTSCGVADVSLSDDRKTLTIETYFGQADSTLIKEIVVNSDISQLIEGYGVWCRMVNDGEPMTIKFVEFSKHVPYYESQKQNGDMIVSDLEKKESDESAENANTENGNAENKNTENKGADKPGNTASDNGNAGKDAGNSGEAGNGNGE